MAHMVHFEAFRMGVAMVLGEVMQTIVMSCPCVVLWEFHPERPVQGLEFL